MFDGSLRCEEEEEGDTRGTRIDEKYGWERRVAAVGLFDGSFSKHERRIITSGWIGDNAMGDEGDEASD